MMAVSNESLEMGMELTYVNRNMNSGQYGVANPLTYLRNSEIIRNYTQAQWIGSKYFLLFQLTHTIIKS
jgi:hypothetical protein